MDDLQRAYDLRHRSDRARLEGRFVEALGEATEAVALYADLPDRALDLANALRLKALALDALDQPGQAIVNWSEARRLYADLGIAEGVTECDARLAM
ncbi:hypothetical protein HZ989_09995 [Brevundimonas sp. AJA228-03]|uniref:hypothetical protein n=1 Tax=Brevundimonas sp. AJA228-03 TaxID=2752515 RepID=UPI001ADF1CFE|nr:hypothetical protein [Brevundimonas sp. AJA228-03]QTN18589.1 hypothetical protein HZ989_09995 [Brevundimonas sp. AJA228-03]